MDRKQKGLDDNIDGNKSRACRARGPRVVWLLYVGRRCDFMGLERVLDQVRVRYTKAGRSTGFTSRRVSCGWRDRSLVKDGAAEVAWDLRRVETRR